MTDFKISNLSKNSHKFLFKKELPIRRKSKRKLIKESSLMLSFSVLIIYITYLIPNKISIFKKFLINFNKLMSNFLDSLYYAYEICLVIFISFSLIFALLLILGAFSRIFKISTRKTRRIKFKN